MFPAEIPREARRKAGGWWALPSSSASQGAVRKPEHHLSRGWDSGFLSPPPPCSLAAHHSRPSTRTGPAAGSELRELAGQGSGTLELGSSHYHPPLTLCCSRQALPLIHLCLLSTPRPAQPRHFAAPGLWKPSRGSGFPSHHGRNLEWHLLTVGCGPFLAQDYLCFQEEAQRPGAWGQRVPCEHRMHRMSYHR